MCPSYQSVLAEFSRLLSTYIVFSGRASFNWAVDWPGLVLFLTGPAHDDNGAQRSSRYLLASGPKQVHALIITIKNNICDVSQLSVCACRILSFIEHVYCFFRSSKFQLGCRLTRVGFVFNRPSPWRQRGTKIQQVSTGLWPATVSYILSYNIRM